MPMDVVINALLAHLACPAGPSHVWRTQSGLRTPVAPFAHTSGTRPRLES